MAEQTTDYEVDYYFLEEKYFALHEDINLWKTIPECACPLCQSVVGMQDLNLAEKVMMCRRSDCIFPFGVARCHIYKTGYNKNLHRFDKPWPTSLAEVSEELDRMQLNTSYSIMESATAKPQNLENLANNEQNGQIENDGTLEKSDEEDEADGGTVGNMAKYRLTAQTVKLTDDEVMKMMGCTPSGVPLKIDVDTQKKKISVIIGGDMNTKK